MLENKCNRNDSHYCLHQCRDRVCGKVSVVKSIFSSGDRRRIQNLVGVMSAFEVKMEDYL